MHTVGKENTKNVDEITPTDLRMTDTLLLK